MITRGSLRGPLASLATIVLLLGACSSSSARLDDEHGSAGETTAASVLLATPDPEELVGPLVPGLPVAGSAVGLGDDVDLDRLAGQCELGVVIACDMLAAVSPPESEYLAFGSSCGGRTTASLSCAVTYTEIDVTTVAFEGETLPEPGPVPSGAGSALDGLARDCRDADLLACDVLQFRADPGSVHQTYASTCGARVDDRVVCTVWFRLVDPAIVPATTTTEPTS